MTLKSSSKSKMSDASKYRSFHCKFRINPQPTRVEKLSQEAAMGGPSTIQLTYLILLNFRLNCDKLRYIHTAQINPKQSATDLSSSKEKRSLDLQKEAHMIGKDQPSKLRSIKFILNRIRISNRYQFRRLN